MIDAPYKGGFRATDPARHSVAVRRAAEAAAEVAVNYAFTRAEMHGELDRALLRETLARTEGNKARAAKLLGMHPNEFYRVLKRRGLTKKDYVPKENLNGK